MNELSRRAGLFITAMLVSILQSTAQSSDPAPLKSTGHIPAEFITLSAIEYKKDVSQTGDTLRVLRKNERDNFYLQTNFFLSDILRSGKILFHDTIGNYLNRITDRLLANDPALRKEIRMYVIMSEVPNAFTGDNGAVFVSIGLISLCQNEAQLAFVLAHEITHYRRKHVVRQYMTDIAVDKNTSDIDVEDRMMQKSVYSQEQETEADLDGLRMLVNAGYPAYEAILALSLLDFYNTPFVSDTTFMPSMLSIGKLDFSKHEVDYSVIEEMKKDGDFADEKEEYETHPAIPARCGKLLDLALSMSADTALRYAESAYFKQIRKIARYELCRLYLLGGWYATAIYSASILKTENPDSPFLNSIIAKGLYGYSMHKLMRDDGVAEKEECGEDAYRTTLFLRSIARSELLLLAISWSVYEYEQWNSEAFYARGVDLITTARKTYDIAFKINSPADTITWGLTDSSALTRMCIEECHRLNSSPSAMKIFHGYSGNYYSHERFHWEEKKDGEYALGIDTLIVLDPFYYRFQPLRKGEIEYRFIASEKGMAKFTNYINHCGEAADMQVSVLSPYAFDTMATDSFNDMALLKDYFEARSYTRDSGLVSVDAERIDTVCKKYGAEQIAVVGEFSVHTHRKKVGLIIASIILWPTLPLGIAYAVSPTYDSFNYVAVYDIQSGQRFQTVHYARQRDTRAAVSSPLYYIFRQIKEKRNK